MKPSSISAAGLQAAEPAMVEQIIRLLERESPSGDLAAVARSAETVAAVGEQVLGARPERIEIDGCTHLLWRLGDQPRVLLLGHHDTVWPVGSLQAHPARAAGGILRGPGCFDMKTGIVMGFHASARARSRAGVAILITGDEETGSRTSRELIEQCAEGCAAVLVLEAAADGGALKTARKGVSSYEIIVHGRAAHSGLEPEKGINAAAELAHQILAVAELADRSSGTTVVPTAASAGTTANTVPASARFAVDVRAWTGAAQKRVDDTIRVLQPQVPGARLEVRGGISRPPLPRAASSALFQRAHRLAAELGIGPLAAAEVGGGSDGNFTAGLGVPTLDGLGAVGGGAHADREHVLVAAITPRTALLAALIDDLVPGGGHR